MANRIMSRTMLVQEATARSEIEQRKADEQGAIAARRVRTRAAKFVAIRAFHVFYQATSTLP